MEKRIYPAIFHLDETVGGYTVDFPDLLGCVTEGDTLDEALTMAADALGLYLSTLKADKQPFPPASDPAAIKVTGKNFTTLIAWDEAAYLRCTDSRAVKKTLTIPAWMDTLAKERHLNFSQILQGALRQKLGIEA